ncbi:phage tail tape measure protein, partial [Salmonella enterica]|nr:phage tail tape measure protein [Salmonella enterica]
MNNSDLVEKRIKRCMESSARSVAASAKSISAAMSQSQVVMRAQSDAVAQLAREADEAREKAVALNQKLRAEAAQSAAVAQAQDLAAAAFFRQLDSVKQLSGGLQELQRIQSQVQHAKNNGDISQQDYLALISDVTAKKYLMAAADEQATQSKNRFIQSLKRQVATQQLSRAELLRVKAAELGVSSAADVYIRKLDTATKSTHALGLKSAQARREIGVLIGELARGNFGALRSSGITLANRAGWIEQLMSPKGMMIGGVVGGIAAAVYGLGKAYYEGEKESEEFNKQLILTGSYAGKTAGQLNEMAKSLAGNGVTQHDAAGVLAQVVGSGSFRGGQVETVARAAVAMQNA